MRYKRGSGIRIKVGIKYCGGCSPQYERVNTLKYIMEHLKERIEITPLVTEEVRIILVIGGCRTMCADISAFKGKIIKTVACEEDARHFIDFIEKTGEQARIG